MNDLEYILMEPGVDRILKGLRNRYRRLILLLGEENLGERRVDLIGRVENDTESGTKLRLFVE